MSLTLRERLADLISGGALSRARNGWVEEMNRRGFAEDQARDQMARAYILQERLNRIAEMETPNANATVKRMANAARKAAME